MDPSTGLDGCEKSGPTGIRSPNRPVRSESLYRLSYPGRFAPVLSYTYDVHVITSHSFKIQFNLTFPSTRRSFKCCRSFAFPL